MVLAPGVAGPLLGGLAASSGYRALGVAATALVGSACVLAVLLLPNLHSRGYATRQTGLRLRAYAGLLRNGAVNWMLVVRAATSMSFGIFMLLAGLKLVRYRGRSRGRGLVRGRWSDRRRRRRSLSSGDFPTLSDVEFCSPDRLYWERSRRSCSEYRRACLYCCSRPVSSGLRRAPFRRCL